MIEEGSILEGADSLPDWLDRASKQEMEHNLASEFAVRQKAAPQQVQNEDGTWPVTLCVDCDEDIEPGRILLGRIRCFQCQSDIESKNKRGLS